MGLLTPAAKAAMDNQSAVWAFLLEMDFTTGVERYATTPWEIQHEGATWNGVGGVGKVSAIESNDDIRPKELTLELIGLPAESLRGQTLKAPQYKGRPARWIFALIDPEAATPVIYTKVMYYYMDTLDYAITDAGAGARLTLEHESTYAARQSRRLYSDQDQQAEYPGDRGFEFLAFLASGRSVRWGSRGRFFVDP